MTTEQATALVNAQKGFELIKSLRDKGARSMAVEASWEVLTSIVWPEYPHGEPLELASQKECPICKKHRWVAQEWCLECMP